MHALPISPFVSYTLWVPSRGLCSIVACTQQGAWTCLDAAIEEEEELLLGAASEPMQPIPPIPLLLSAEEGGRWTCESDSRVVGSACRPLEVPPPI